MEASSYKDINFEKCKWLNEPKAWSVKDNVLSVITDNKTDFWRGTYYNFYFNTGHVYGIELKDDFVFQKCKWLNEPKAWSVKDNVLSVITDNKTDFWRGTYHVFYLNTGHVYGIELKDDFVFQVCIEADFTTLYDQAGLMMYLDEKHWLKAGIEYNDGQPMISSVVTNELSDWGTGVYTANPSKFYLRISKKSNAVCVKHSADNVTWTLLRLCSMPARDKYFIGPMTCTPQREGLRVQFSELSVTVPGEDILHAN